MADKSQKSNFEHEKAICRMLGSNWKQIFSLLHTNWKRGEELFKFSVSNGSQCFSYVGCSRQDWSC